MAERYEEFDEEWDPDFKSKSQVKRELQALKDMGKELIALPLRDLNKLALDEELYDAVVKAQAMSKGALKRQTGFIGGVIAKLDYEKIEQDLYKLKQPHQGEVKRFHQLESWRDQLISGDSDVYAELMTLLIDFDMQHVRQLVRNAQKEAREEKSPKSARALFQYLQSLDWSS